MIDYKKGSLFKAPLGSLLVHSCNCKGVWGSGVAKEMKERFPQAHLQYVKSCSLYGDALIGKARIYLERGYLIGCLFTSKDYGERRDDPMAINERTLQALDGLYRACDVPIHAPKINSGLFGVPWDMTARTIEQMHTFHSRQDKWTVWEL